MTETEENELLELSTIPILENELMWIVRVTDGDSNKELSNSDHNDAEST